MKQKDWALIIVIVFISAVFSFVISGLVIKTPKKGTQKIEVVEKISSDFLQPDKKYFNSSSVDPTQVIHIGDNTNTTPFNTKVTR